MTWNIVKDYLVMSGQRRRVVLIGGLVIGVVFSLILTTILLLFKQRVEPEFQRIQQSEVAAQLHLVQELVRKEHESLKSSVSDWGYWDLLYNFVDGTNPAFVKENLTVESLNNLNIQIMAIVNKQKQISAEMYLDSENGLETNRPEGLMEYLVDDSWYEAGSDAKSGVMKLGGKFAFVAIYPISNSMDESLASNGWIMMARYLSDELLKNWETFGTMKLAIEQNQLEVGANQFPYHVMDVLGKEIGNVEVVNDFQIMSVSQQLMRVIFLVSVIAMLLFAVMGFMLWCQVNIMDERRQRLAQQSMEAMREQNKKLASTQEQLSTQMTEAVEKARVLEETKAAMMNLLEDAKELEEQLKTEKEGVEEKIIERTKDLEETKKQLTNSWLEQQQEKARLMASINSLTVGFVMTNELGEVVMVNHRVHEVLKVEHDPEWTLDKIDSLIGESGKLKLAWIDCIHEGKEIQLSEVGYKEGFLRVLLTPIVLPEDKLKVIGTVMLFEDISEAKKLQKTRDEFFAVASHELRTPLTAIRGNMSMINDYFPDVVNNPEVKQMIEDTHTASVRLIAIVNDFLDASRLELNKLEFKTEEFDLDELVDHVMTELKVGAEEKKLSWEWQGLGNGQARVKADKNRTEQILLNLAGNALKFTVKGKVRAEVQANGEVIMVRIIDTGAGVPLDQQGKLFMKFQQSNTNIYTRDVSGGTGMGLYVSKLLAEGMGGRLYLEKSEPGVGSVFCLELLKK
jgi:signal transduction histidine kinase/sensor domain CHASE-containing protein